MPRTAPGWELRNALDLAEDDVASSATNDSIGSNTHIFLACEQQLRQNLSTALIGSVLD